MRHSIKTDHVEYDEDHERLSIVLPNGRRVEAHASRTQMSRAMEQAKILQEKCVG